jgi:hypothetical protein
MRRLGWIAVVALVLALTTPASANTPTSFTACGSDTKGGDCTSRVQVGYGQTVYLKARVKPPHADLTAGVWHKGFYPDDVWEKWDTVPISDTGVMKYRWETTIDDGSQESWHKVQFRIQGHGKSTIVKVRVWLGE